MLTIVRAIHFGAVIVLFGQFAFQFAVSPAKAPPPHLRRIAGWSLVVALVTGLCWLALEAQAMSGLPFAEALGVDTLCIVVSETLFGRVWLLRMALGAALCGVLIMRNSG